MLILKNKFLISKECF